jgi:hypothetical protein
MDINQMNPKTVAVLDLKLNQKPYSGSGICRNEKHTNIQY